MWSLSPKKRKEKEESGPSEWARAEEQVAALRAWRGVGEEFEYMGRRMVVVKHSRIGIASGYPLPVPYLIPELHARYADNNGQLHELVLSAEEVLALVTRRSGGGWTAPTEWAAPSGWAAPPR